jgi:hypothetical protein
LKMTELCASFHLVTRCEGRHDDRQLLGNGSVVFHIDHRGLVTPTADGEEKQQVVGNAELHWTGGKKLELLLHHNTIPAQRGSQFRSTSYHCIVASP